MNVTTAEPRRVNALPPTGFPSAVVKCNAPLVIGSLFAKYDPFPLTMPDGSKGSGWLEKGKGKYVYFEHGDHWRKFPLGRYPDGDLTG